MDIAEKTILITGANRGIGRALVEEALRRGAKRIYAGTRDALGAVDERVTPIALDVTNAVQISRAADRIDELDVLINNAGVAVYGDFANFDRIEEHMAVNLFGALNVTRAFLPQLRRSRGAVVNQSSLAALAAVPMLPAYSISKAAALNMTQALRALLRAQGVSVHAVILGPVDTQMNRGLDIAKATAESVAQRIFEGLRKGEEDIFPDAASQTIEDNWRAGAAKGLERQFAAFVPTAQTA